jgi:hypothetical protein
VQSRQSVTRLLALAPLALAAAACFALSGCSPGLDYPSIFPAVHDMPPPRADTPLDANQVQQATEDLITDRNHLNAQAQGSGQGSGQSTNASNPPAKKPPASQAPAASSTAPGAAAAGTQTAGAETK